MTKKQKMPMIVSSVLKIVASENLVSDAELKDTIDKPLEEILNAAQEEQTTNREEATK